ncbi:hypothetical protein LTR85_000117 [Meristemomyces frigidus]|nr:hypothetical protein LTR85_000117 [Meristemomyces frigidus]
MTTYEHDPGRTDSDAYRVPFDSRLLEGALGFAPKGAPDSLTNAELLAWISSAPVRSSLEHWKRHVVDNPKMRAMVQPGMCADYNVSCDTIDTLTGLCSQASSQPSADEAFETTAHFAADIANASQHADSPLFELKEAGELHWCYGFAVRLLVTAFHDLITSKRSDGYFIELLGGPMPRPIRDRRLLDGMMRIDNSPLRKDNKARSPSGRGTQNAYYGRLETGAEQKARKKARSLEPLAKA